MASPKGLPIVRNDDYRQNLFSVGDVVKYDPNLVCNVKKSSDALKKCLEKYVDAFGTVSESGSKIKVQYKTLGKVIQHSSAFFWKLNEFSIGQVIQIKCDDVTVGEIVKEFGQVHDNLEKIEGLVGRVTGVDEQDPSRLYIRFDSLKIYEWLEPRKSLPSAWMDHLESAETILDDEFQEIMAKIEALMFQAATEGEIRIAKLLHLRHGMDANVLNAYGMTMLHIACQSGQKDFVDWLINEVKVDVEKADGKGLRAIHHATIRGDLEILNMLIDRGVQLDSGNNDGKTALSIAILNHKLDCVRLLVQRGCNVNAQDFLGNTPFHNAVHFISIPLEIIQILADSGRVDYAICNKRGLNALHLAIRRRNTEAIRFIMEINAEQLLEAKDVTGMSPFLVACRMRDYLIMELLIKAGANISAVDYQGNNAIVLSAATNMKTEEFPPKDLCPEVFKMVEKHPSVSTLFLIGYLIDKGCKWDFTNLAGEKASDILLAKGFHPEVIELFEKFSVKTLVSANRVSGRQSCMGHTNCTFPPAFQLSCPHKPTFMACPKCFMATFEVAKCGCLDYDISVTAVSKPVKVTLGGSLVKNEKEEMTNKNLAENQNHATNSGYQGEKRKADRLLHDEADSVVPPIIKRERCSEGVEDQY